jgi:hypothetical protein
MDSKNIEICDKVAELGNMGNTAFLELGKGLAQIRDEELFAGQWETFNDFLDDKKIAKSTANKLINVYKTFVEDCGIPLEELKKANWYDLSEVRKMAKDKKSAEEWLNKAIILNRADLRKEVTEQNTGIQMADCKHEITVDMVMRKCETCKDVWRTYDEANSSRSTC